MPWSLLYFEVNETTDVEQPSNSAALVTSFNSILTGLNSKANITLGLYSGATTDQKNHD